MLVGALGSFAWAMFTGKINVPTPTVEVQQGYVCPDKLEIRTRDMYCDGVQTPIVRYNGKSYLFKEGKDGRPVALEYKIQAIEEEKR